MLRTVVELLKVKEEDSDEVVVGGDAGIR